MNLTPESVLWVIGIGASISTIVFWGSFYLGQLVSGLKRAHERLDEHDEIFADAQLRRRGDRPMTHPRWEDPR